MEYYQDNQDLFELQARELSVFRAKAFYLMVSSYGEVLELGGVLERHCWLTRSGRRVGRRHI